MSNFRIGQRVRLVRYPTVLTCVTNPVPLGAEGIITALKHAPKGAVCRGGTVLTEDIDCHVDYGSIYGVRSSNTYRLEPILPSGAAPSELSYTELMDRLKAGEVECV